MSEEVPAVRVHVASSDVPLGAQKPRGRRHVVAIPHTVYLSAQTPVDIVFGKDPSRKVAYVQAIGNDVTLCTSKSNAAAGEGAISPDEGGRLARLVEIFLRAVETGDFERRLQLLENTPPTPPY